MEQRYNLGYQSGMEEQNYDLLFWLSELQSHWAQLGTALNSNIQSRAVAFCVYIVNHCLTGGNVFLPWLGESLPLLFFNSDMEM